MTINKEFKEITKIKKALPQEIYIKYLESVLKILLKQIDKINKLELYKLK